MVTYPASFCPGIGNWVKPHKLHEWALRSRGPSSYTTANFEVRTLAFQMPDRGGGPTGPRIRVGRPSRRARTLLMTLGVLAVLAMVVRHVRRVLDRLALVPLGRTTRSVFTTTLWTKVGLFAVFGLLMAAAVGLNIWLAHRLRPPLSAMSLEQQSLDRYRMSIAPYKKWVLLGDHRAGRADRRRLGRRPVADLADVGQRRARSARRTRSSRWTSSFYAFDLPWYRFLLGFGFAAAVLSLIAAALTHYLYGGLRITSPGRACDGRGDRASVGAARRLRRAQGRRVLARPVRARGEVQRLQGDRTTGRACGTSTPTPICRRRRSCSASPSSARCCSSPRSGGAPGSCR